jgi:hypothetical protein
MLTIAVYYIWRERNAPRTGSMVFRDIVSCIVSKVNSIHNMAYRVLIENFILRGDFLMIFSILFDMIIGYLGFEDIFS